MSEAPATDVASEPVEWLGHDEQRIWRRLLAVECKLRETLDAELQAAHGITLGDYGVLVHLSEVPSRSLRMSELADRLLLSRSGLTRRIDALVRAGLVTRQAYPADGRASLASLTNAGFELLRVAAPVHVAGVRRYLLSPVGGLAGLDAGLGRVERALGDG